DASIAYPLRYCGHACDVPSSSQDLLLLSLLPLGSPPTLRFVRSEILNLRQGTRLNVDDLFPVSSQRTCLSLLLLLLPLLFAQRVTNESDFQIFVTTIERKAMTQARHSILLLILVLSGSSFALAQTGSGTITGIIKDPTDAPIPGVSVKV